jgi:hypothetical protein
VRNGFYCGVEGSILPVVEAHKILFSGEGMCTTSMQAGPSDRMGGHRLRGVTSPRRQSPVKARLSHRQRENVKDRVILPKHDLVLSRSPSPAGKRESWLLSSRFKRLSRAQDEQEGAEVTEGDCGKPLPAEKSVMRGVMCQEIER